MSIGTLFILAAPSGAGKTSLSMALCERCTDLTISISHTTRAMRSGESDGEHYFFVSDDTFHSMIQEEDFLEHANVFGHRYGTSKEWVLKTLRKGIDVILEIDWQGAKQVRTKMPTTSIFVLPPSRKALLSRLQRRGQDNADVISKRINHSREEIEHYVDFDYLVINDCFEVAVDELTSIIRAKRLERNTQAEKHQGLINDLLAAEQ